MITNTALVRSMIVYAICLPLALILGYLIANPLDRTTDIKISGAHQSAEGHRGSGYLPT